MLFEKEDSMQIFWLEAFIAVAERMNFSDAATDLYISQSSLSKYIQMIEKQISVPLFDRSRRKIILTPAGSTFYHYATDIVARYHEMLQVMEKYTYKGSSRVRVVSVSAPHINGFTFLFARFGQEHPEIDFSLQEEEMSRAMNELQAGNADFAIVRTNLIPNLDQYKEIRFNTEEMYLICGECHPLGQKDKVSLGDILKEKLVLQKFAVDELRMLFRKYHLPDYNMKIQLISTRSSMLLEYLRSGLGVSIVSATLANHIDPKGSLRMIPIHEKPEMSLGLICPKGALSSACETFYNYMDDIIKSKTIDYSSPHVAETLE